VRPVQLRTRQGRGDLTHSVPVRDEPDDMHGCTPALSCPSQMRRRHGGLRAEAVDRPRRSRDRCPATSRTSHRPSPVNSWTIGPSWCRSAFQARDRRLPRSRAVPRASTDS
jgi:hypothetical protein